MLSRLFTLLAGDPSPNADPPTKRRKLATAPMPPPQTPSEETPPVQIDGSRGEGGGQILRISLSLSSILSRPVQITSIRASRPTPGLQAQHLTSAHLVAQITKSVLQNAVPSSQTLVLSPPTHPPLPPSLPLQATVPTAGATALVLQAALPPALRYLPSTSAHFPTTLQLSGGTTALYAPTSAYLIHVLAPLLISLFHLDLRVTLIRHGFFPRGAGRCDIAIDKTRCEPASAPHEHMCVLSPLDLPVRGEIISIAGHVLLSGAQLHAARLDECIAEAAVRVIRKYVRSHTGYPQISVDDICLERATSDAEKSGMCVAITLHARTAAGAVLGASALWSPKASRKGGRRRGREDRGGQVSAWQNAVKMAGEAAADELCAAFECGAAVDGHMADQVCIFMVMARGMSRVLVPSPSSHLRSVVQVCQEFGVDIRLEDAPGDCGNCMLVCEGLGIPLPR